MSEKEKVADKIEAWLKAMPEEIFDIFVYKKTELVIHGSSVGDKNATCWSTPTIFAHAVYGEKIEKEIPKKDFEFILK